MKERLEIATSAVGKDKREVKILKRFENLSDDL